ncbi:MAG: IS4 family transposase [Microscillaceae bacterium]|nr:IS4 family transposase [Microscillaceae bacterium]
MTYSPKIVEIIGKLKDFLTSPLTKATYRVSESDFSRASGKLDFAQYALLGISLLKNSLASELYNLLTNNALEVVTKSAYSQARYKIAAEFYQAWQAELLHGIEEAGFRHKTWRGYGLKAYDGSSLVLPQTPEMAAHFGTQIGGGKGKKTETAMAKCLFAYDLLNGYILQTELFKTTESELSIFKKVLWQVCAKSINLLDRGFASAAIFAYLCDTQKPFVCRLKVSFNQVVKDFMASEATDQIVHFTVSKTESFAHPATEEGAMTELSFRKGDTFPIRLVKIILPSGEIEVLATNLMDSEAISRADLGELYHLRWGIETMIDSVKNQCLMMVFSGLKPLAIAQEVYATMFVYNLRQLLINEAQIQVDEGLENRPKPTRPRKINKNVALGVLKPKIISLFLSQEPAKIVAELIRVFTQNTESVVDNKVQPKRKKSLAKRRNLVTQNNFKRAV